ncbi:hypothetical protein SMACR_12842 [Sordaria macrospora]|uniref:Uncharacterized protein n=1 Tax=Sordaria macrospora TaxID=5147 RepID=A0A8S8ZYS4_SORMA|nr:hypothetical protein SMACR_12842 [Sordaria macrospora]WPJ63084.1 hypothetical protein SMAC4_13618 [Sordaria macrospora]
MPATITFNTGANQTKNCRPLVKCDQLIP